MCEARKKENTYKCTHTYTYILYKLNLQVKMSKHMRIINIIKLNKTRNYSKIIANIKTFF